MGPNNTVLAPAYVGKVSLHFPHGKKEYAKWYMYMREKKREKKKRFNPFSNHAIWLARQSATRLLFERHLTLFLYLPFSAHGKKEEMEGKGERERNGGHHSPTIMTQTLIIQVWKLMGGGAREKREEKESMGRDGERGVEREAQWMTLRLITSLFTFPFLFVT